MDTNFNNSVYDARGELIGFRCFDCQEVKPAMWGNTCNACRKAAERHRDIITAIGAHNGEAK